jgi:acylphosphatase
VALTDLVARSVTVRGLVQGVFFRDTTRKVARSIGVAGWVSNESDGTVQAWLEGEPDAVDQVLRFLRTGPPEAEVVSVTVDEEQPAGHDTFEIR